MASLRFKKNGTPFVDFRCQGNRYRPEFLSVNDARKFQTLASASPVEAFRLWQDSIAELSSAPQVGGVSLKALIEQFKEHYCSRRVRGVEMRGHIDRFFAFVLERHAVSDMCPKEISLNDFESYQSKLRDRGLKNSSNNRNFNTIKTFFARLLKERKIDFDFAKLVESLKVDEVQREAWDLKDTPILVSKLIEKDADPVLIDIVKSNEFTPFGPTDYKRVKWKDYDFNIGEIQTFRMKGKGKRVWNVPITLGYQKLLLQIRKRQESIGLGKPNDYVYLTRDKKPLNPTWVSKSLERARKEAGILNVPYTSRHRILTEVSEKLGVDTASKFAGHASVRTTEKHYLVGGSENFRKKVKEVLR